ncbi:hypothetical protein DFR70_102945 [Nocardia tenerifensis]|uniref:Uncharacterized protein n=1 Tax=Nocardia tenerifensis TaxID=228006 RepID=A0A318KCJ0_9NOCA|nr:hypothetical protein [Nocardia tenerifensis]PXX69256.1 hypothetical protein DFR70_102945 [Nocardia tenerifensis]
MAENFLAAALVVITAVTLARTSLWRSEPQTRLLTVVLALFAVSGAATHPWVRDAVDTHLRLPGWVGMADDVVLLTAVCLMCAYLARIWGFDTVARIAVAAAPALALSLAVAYTLTTDSDRRHHYIGELSGPATVSGLIVSIGLLIATLAMFATVLVARPLSLTHLWFGVAAAAGLALAALRAAATIDPGRFADPYWSVRYTLATLFLLAVSAAGITNLRNKRRSRVRSR